MLQYDAHFLVPNHCKPLANKEEIAETLAAYRDAIKFVHDQTIKLMNQGKKCFK